MATRKTNKNYEDVNRITFNYNGTEYIMEYDRDTAIQTEKTYGLSMNDVRDGKLSAFESLFNGAFIKHHPNIKQTTLDLFWSSMPNKPELFRNLTMMYVNCINTLLEEPEEGNAISWTTA